jgi:hypothetical protein
MALFSIEHPIYMAPWYPGGSTDGEGCRTWPINRYSAEGPRTTDWLKVCSSTIDADRISSAPSLIDDAGAIGARRAAKTGQRRGLEIAAVQRTMPGETDDQVTPIEGGGKLSERVRGLPLHPSGCAALASFASGMSSVAPGWLEPPVQVESV